MLIYRWIDISTSMLISRPTSYHSTYQHRFILINTGIKMTTSTKITASQQNFLSAYNQTGNIETTLSTVGIEMNHLLAWCQESPNFDIEYRKAKRFYISHMRSNGYMLALQTVHDTIVAGCIKEHTIEQSSKLDKEGNQYFETKLKTVTRPVPFAYLQLMLQESSLMGAIQRMSDEGLLTSTQYKQLMSLSDDISNKGQQIMLGDSNADTLTEDKAVALIKQAMLGNLPEPR